jgi:hypothetical protein
MAVAVRGLLTSINSHKLTSDAREFALTSTMRKCPLVHAGQPGFDTELRDSQRGAQRQRELTDTDWELLTALLTAFRVAFERLRAAVLANRWMNGARSLTH